MGMRLMVYYHCGISECIINCGCDHEKQNTTIFTLLYKYETQNVQCEN